MEQYTKSIKCPEHEDNCKATLFCYPHEYAGIWECNDISDTHEHEDTHMEEVEVDTMRNGEHGTYNTNIEICDECEITIND